MEKRIICVLIMAAFMIPGAFAKGPKVEIKSNIEGLGAAPQVYYTYDAAPGKKEIYDTAKKLWKNINRVTHANLNLNLIDMAEGSDKLTIESENVIFNVFSPKTLGFIYSKPLEQYLMPVNGEGVSITLMDNGRTEQTARDYLSKLDLIPQKSGEMYIARIGKVRSANSQDKTKIYERMQVVYIGRKLNNVPVFGASRIVVRLGEGGELIGIIKNWPSVKKQSLSNEKAMRNKADWKDLSIKHVKGTPATSAYSSVLIDSSELVMYDDGEAYIEPALLLKGSMLSDSGETVKSDWLVPLLADPKANYHSEGTPESTR